MEKMKRLFEKFKVFGKRDQLYSASDWVATVREKVLENEKFSRSGKSRELHFQ